MDRNENVLRRVYRRSFLKTAALTAAGSAVAPGLWPRAADAQDNGMPDWTTRIRADHPRLFLHADMLPGIRERARNEQRGWFEAILADVDRLAAARANGEPEPRDLGPEAAQSAFIGLVTGDSKCVDLALEWLETSLDYYDLCYQERRTVNWYATSRVHAALAWDWLYAYMNEEQRARLLKRLIQAIDNVLKAEPRIPREHPSGYDRGFYGVRSCKWFIGCTGFRAGVDDDRINEWLTWGYEENMRLLNYRAAASGEDGGSASASINYAFGAYPWADQNFLYTWLSATGEDITGDWPYVALLGNYVLWNWIEAEPRPLEFGYGDTQHRTNELRTHHLYTHMANIRQLYAETMPDGAALARHVQERIPENHQRYTKTWFIYPFLFGRLDETAEPLEPEGLPMARHFDNMGQVFMRSGHGVDDAYCLFACGGTLRQHRHYDALHFTIYHHGFLALDSGTRYRENENGQHLANYYAQTVAHNCVLIHQPDEPPANYWGGTVRANHGGQHDRLGSEVTAFETNDDFVYAAGDGTKTYLHGGGNGLPEKAKEVTRQIIFLPPSHFIVFDRVETTDPDYKKEWLLHTAHEPHIDGKTFRAEHGQGRMFCRTLLPEDAVIELVGGPGKEFWAAGRNWDIVDGGLTDEERAMMGQWRVEVSPGAARAKDVFLHVIQTGTQTMEHMSHVELVEKDAGMGARLVRDGETWEVTFRVDGPLGGHIRRAGGPRPALDRALTQSVQPQTGIWAR